MRPHRLTNPTARPTYCFFARRFLGTKPGTPCTPDEECGIPQVTLPFTRSERRKKLGRLSAGEQDLGQPSPAQDPQTGNGNG